MGFPSNGSHPKLTTQVDCPPVAGTCHPSRAVLYFDTSAGEVIAVTETIQPDHRMFVSYIDKSREYYLAQGYTNPYRWAYHQDSPFTQLEKPLAEARVGLVTTASIPEDGAHLEPFPVPDIVYAAPMDPPPVSLYTQHRSWDTEATHTNDLDSFAPIHRLQEAVIAGRVGSLSPRFYGAPTEYSQRKTNEVDAPQLLRFCQQDGVDAAILVAL